jgi:uncharacterized membrane protein
MAGAVLNYYVYWYRFGHFVSSVLGMQVWDVYHVMTAFALAFYGAVLFQIVRCVLGGSILVAGITSVIVPFGSNIAGFLLWNGKDDNWWGPSRVVKGAINEFPAWSFILGDLHPHFLNLGLLPFGILLLYRIVTSRENSLIVGTSTIFLSLLGILWLFASNAWEVPMWVGCISLVAILAAAKRWNVAYRWLGDRLAGKAPYDVVQAGVSLVVLFAGVASIALLGARNSAALSVAVALGAIAFFYAFFPFKKDLIPWARFILSDRRCLGLVVFGSILAVALRLSSRHIVPEGGALHFVRAPIEVTQTKEMFLHWGFPLTLAALGSLFLLRRNSVRLVCLGLMGSTLLFDKGALFLFALGSLQLVRLLSADRRSREVFWSNVFSDALLLGGIGLVFLPEIVFLDDAYGGENERMNTIFKIYETSWALLTLGAISIFTRGLTAICHTPQGEPRLPGLLASCGWTTAVISSVVTLPFFYHAAKLRMPSSAISIVAPASEGLSELEQRFPGSVAIVRTLRDQPKGVVLEAQGNAYDYTSFVSTLASQTAFLGWANHVNLLTKKFNQVSGQEEVNREVSRREQFTEAFYLNPSCANRIASAREEGISFVVVGSKEVQKYPQLRNADFSCFKELAKDREYRLFSTTLLP